MPDDDARLTDFIGAGSGAVDDAEADEHDDAAAEGADEPDDQSSDRDVEDVEPAAATADWTPGGAKCAGCGTVVERRWREDGAFVCADCRDW